MNCPRQPIHMAHLGSAYLTTSVFFSSSQFLSYQDKRINHGNLPHLQQRVRFAASDPSQYDASINLMNLQVSDTATYECRVKKTTMATRKVIVTVQGMASLFSAVLCLALLLGWTHSHFPAFLQLDLQCLCAGLRAT